MSIQFAPDEQFSGPVVDRSHCVQRFTRQVQYGLLKLHTLARNQRKVLGELDPHDHAGVLEFTRQQGKHFSCSFVQVYRFGGGALAPKEGRESRNYFQRTVAVANRAPHGLARGLELGRICGKHPQAGVGVRDDAAQRLFEFEGNRCRHYVEALDRFDVC